MFASWTGYPRGCRSQTGDTGSGRRPQRLHIAQRFGGVARTAKVHQQGGLGAGEEVLGGRHEVGRSVGLDLEVVLGVQGLEQGVADELAGAGTGEDDVEIILLDD